MVIDLIEQCTIIEIRFIGVVPSAKVIDTPQIDSQFKFICIFLQDFCIGRTISIGSDQPLCLITVQIINPSVSILAQPSVAIVDDNADANGTQEVSRQYLEYLYSDEAQRLIGTYGL